MSKLQGDVAAFGRHKPLDRELLARFAVRVTGAGLFDDVTADTHRLA